jgi:hypothetical protein
MGTKLTWKRKNESDQVISHCGRYWISLPDQYVSGCNLWHDDTGVKINTFGTPALAKVAAQHHLDNLRSAWQVMLDGIQPLRRPDRVEDDGGPTAEDLGHAPGDVSWCSCDHCELDKAKARIKELSRQLQAAQTSADENSKHLNELADLVIEMTQK